MTAGRTVQVQMATTFTGFTAGTTYSTVTNSKTTVTHTGQHPFSEPTDTLAGAIRIGTEGTRVARLRATSNVCPQGKQINMLNPMSQSRCPRRTYPMLVTGGTIYTQQELGFMTGTSRRPWLALRFADPRSLAGGHNPGRALAGGLADEGFLVTDLQLEVANPGFVSALVSSTAGTGGTQASQYSGTVALASLSRALSGDPLAQGLPFLSKDINVRWKLRLAPGGRPS
jgi:hypothetical protein